MNPVDIIVKKRDGQALSADEIAYFVDGFAKGTIPDYQAAAWAMAVYFQGMTGDETTALTLAMAESGEQLDLHGTLPPGTVIVDKHSSGGVGDKTTLAVGPIVAACGLYVGKMSGRGLSFTGGTIDKLESFAGWSPDLSEDAFRRQLHDIQLAVAGQTEELATADKALYALRDVTGTVPSLPLIASSIMSKKLAAGADAIVLDVKCGRGAFMQTQDDAKQLAQLMVEIGSHAGRKMVALITQMEQPLGHAVGNALEVQEAIATLRGEGPEDFQELVEQIAVEMLLLGAPDRDELDEQGARTRVAGVIKRGMALAKLREFVVAQGGDGTMVDHPERLPSAPVQRDVISQETGYVASVAPREIGLAAMALGGGRQKKGDPIDHRVGVVVHKKVGDTVRDGSRLATIHAATAADADNIYAAVAGAFEVDAQLVMPLPMVLERITDDNLAMQKR